MPARAIAAPPDPELNVRLHVVLVTDDRARPILELGEPELKRIVAQADSVLGVAGIRLRFDYPADVSVASSNALLDQAAMAYASSTASEDGETRQPDFALLDAVARRHPGRITAFVALIPKQRVTSTEYEVTMRSGDVIMIDGRKFTLPWDIKLRIRYNLLLVDGYAEYCRTEREPRFIVLANYEGDRMRQCGPGDTVASRHGTVLAHEIGHALGLKHTFRKRFRTIERARSYFERAGRIPDAFDGDGLADTAPDPGVEMSRCELSGTPQPIGDRVFETSGNLMSYTVRFSGDGPVLSQRQIGIIRHETRRMGLDVRGWSAHALGELITREPGHPEARFARARIRLSAGRAAEAAADLRVALETRPSWHEALVLLGISGLASFDVTAAVTTWEAAVSARPDSAAAHLGRSLAWRAQGEPEAAGAEYGAARSANEAGEERWEGGTILARRALWAEGVDAAAGYALLCAGAGASALAEPALSRLAAQEAEYAAALAAHGRKEAAASARRCESIVAANPRHWMAWQLLGNIRLQSGRERDAREAWQRSLDLHPGNAVLREYLHSLDQAGRSGKSR